MKRKTSLKITSIFLGLFVTFLFIEIAYRVKLRYFAKYEEYLATKKIIKYSENEKLLVELIPNASVTIKNKNYSVNSFGFRDNEWNLKDTTNINIGLISDSVGFPFGLNHDEGYEAQAEVLLSKDSIAVEIMNFSLNGYNANQYIEVLKNIKHKGIKLDYLIANITYNDNQPTGKPSMLSWIDHPTSKYEWIPSKFVKRIIEFYYRKKVHPNLTSFSYIENYIQNLIDFQKQNKTKIVVLLTPSKGEDINTGFYYKTKKYAEENGLKVIFPVDKFDIVDKTKLFYTNDSMHLSKEGHTVIAEQLKNYFKLEIKK